MRGTCTYTYALLEVSPAAYDEIKRLLDAAGHKDQFHDTHNGVVIDMYGLALQRGKESESTEEASSGEAKAG